MTFSIIVVTLGRPSLPHLLGSIARQIEMGDEVLVVGERPDSPARACVEELGWPFRFYFCPDPAPRLYGQPQRNWIIALAKGDYLNYQDDDDEMANGIMPVMRRNCKQQPGKIFIYQMRKPDGSLHPGYPPERLAGGQCFVWPNIPGRMGLFTYKYTGDQDFMNTTIALHPEGRAGVVHCPEIITEYAGNHPLPGAV